MIPVIPGPVFPGSSGSGLDPVFGPDLRASDFDRDVAADMLCAAVADGRISLAELDQRLENVLSARTLREIARVMADLPGPAGPGPQRPGPAAVRAARPAPRRAAPSERWALLQTLLTPAPALSPAGAGGPG
jgi:hypothetical protein